MKKILYYILPLILVILVATGCKKEFLDVNTNPNSPTDASITPDLILPRAQAAIASRMATSYAVEARWMGYWARGGDYGSGGEEENYQISTTFEADEWSGWYDILFDLNTMEKKAEAAGQGYYQGVAKILKSVGFMYLVDQYNNVPYTKAFDLVGNILPAYDKGQAIYTDIIKGINDGVALIQASNPQPAEKTATADIIYKGNKTNWIKFANTQHLKLLLRQAYISGFDPTAEIAKINANGVGYIGAGETASAQPNYVVDNGKQNPFWNVYKLLYTGGEADKYNRANNYVLGLLRTSNDIRYQYYFSPAATPVAGNTYYGYNFGETLSNSDPYKSANSSNVAGPGLAKSATQAQWVFTATESLFLQAEARQRNWIAGAQTAEQLFNAGITESYTWLGVTNAATAAATYIASGNQYSNFAGAGDKIKAIVMQKYLSLVGVNNFEAWVEWRRIPGDPAIPSTTTPPVPFSLSQSRDGKHVPLRLQYPQDEYNYNAANVGAEGTINTQTSRIFWDIN